MRLLFCVLLASALVGCAASDRRLDNLTASTSPQLREFTLTEKVSVKTRPEDLHALIRWERCHALPGKYVAYKSNAQGTLYVGERAAILQESEGKAQSDGGSMFVRRGGIWIPSTPGSAPRLFGFPLESVKVEGQTVLLDSVPDDHAKAVDAAINSLVAGKIAQATIRPAQGAAAGAISGAIIGAMSAGLNEPVFIGSEITDTSAAERIRAAAAAGIKE